MNHRGIRNIIKRRIEIMGPPPPEVMLVRSKLKGLSQEYINGIPDATLDAAIRHWLREAGYEFS
jgi:hypothetical protein